MTNGVSLTANSKGGSSNNRRGSRGSSQHDQNNFDLYRRWNLFGRNSNSNSGLQNEENEKPPCIKGAPGYNSDIFIPKGNYTVEIFHGNNPNSPFQIQNDVEIGTGAAYTFAIFDLDTDFVITQDINTNDISMLWIVPQFFIITMAEVMISITGLEFAYTQAPVTLKSVLASCWLLTVSFGNFVVIIVAEGRLMPTQVKEYYLFMVLIIVADIIFILLARKFPSYVYILKIYKNRNKVHQKFGLMYLFFLGAFLTAVDRRRYLNHIYRFL